MMAVRKTLRTRKQRVQRTPKRRLRRGHGTTTIPTPPVGEVERVLALDSSSKACGWSVFDDGLLVSHGCYRQTGSGHGERLMRFRLWLLGMCRELQPHRVIYEAPYQGRMKNTFGILSRYVGVIEAACFEHFQQELERTDAVPAHLVKKAIGAKKGADHEANKRIVVTLINEHFGLSLKFKANDTTKRTSQDDQADAIALNWAWHLMYREDGEAA